VGAQGDAVSRARLLLLLVLAAVTAAGIGGYWFGRHGTALLPLAPMANNAPLRVPSGPVIYYQDPDGKPFYSAEPKQTADGRPYREVHASEDVNFDPQEHAAPAEAAAKRILYYRNPMGLPDVSKTPKKDPMGMDYIPVYEGDEDDSGIVKISPGKLQRIGVATEPAKLRVIAQPVRAPGTIQLDERRIAVISIRAEGFVDTVENVTTGSEVRKDQPLLRLYSPAITSAAAEFVSTLNLKGEPSVTRGPRQRLLNYAVAQSLIDQIERTRQVPLTFTWSAPRDGIVLERNVVDGQRVMPGDVLFRLADHSVIWANVDVAERDLAAVAEGQPVTVRVRSYPDRTFSGKVALVYPHLNPATRTVRVRIELPNADFLLRPDMYAEAEIDIGSGTPVVAVPDSAVIDSGSRQVVIVDRGEGRFEPRPVKLGRRGAGYVEITEGVKENEAVVTSANFLIDAESNLKAALKGLSDAGAPR
jgi:Cu(I)/Ag(I) efflux system membrane fusion protein